MKSDTCKQEGVLKLRFSSISTLAQSPSHSPSKSPTQAPAPKASVLSPTIRKTSVPALSPAVVNLNRLLGLFCRFFLLANLGFSLENLAKERGLEFYFVIVL